MLLRSGTRTDPLTIAFTVILLGPHPLLHQQSAWEHISGPDLHPMILRPVSRLSYLLQGPDGALTMPKELIHDLRPHLPLQQPARLFRQSTDQIARSISMPPPLTMHTALSPLELV